MTPTPKKPSIPNRGIKSGPGPLRVIYEKIKTLESEVYELKSELRLVKRKLNSYEHERVNSVSVKDVLVDRIKEQSFTLTLTPAAGDPINITEPCQLSSSRIPSPHQQNPLDIRVNQHIFDKKKPRGPRSSHQIIVPDRDIHMVEETSSDVENEEKFTNPGEIGPPYTSTPIHQRRTVEGSPNQCLNSEAKRITKKFDPIWNEYHVSIGRNGKREATCRRCGKDISAQAPRLKDHIARNCKGKFGKAKQSTKMQRISRNKSKPPESEVDDGNSLGGLENQDTENAHNPGVIDSDDPDYFPGTPAKILKQGKPTCDVSADEVDNDEDPLI